MRLASFAVIAFVCSLVSLTGCQDPVDSLPKQLTAQESASSTTNEESKKDSTKVQTIAFRVGDMTCPTGCYPSVKAAIAKQKGVSEIELAPQKEADVIDNPIVNVKYRGDLDVKATITAIEKAGFEQVEVVTN